ncbi:MAG: sugar kinase [Clostridiales bacterium]|jgi:2-dehydro-3-deoxygluconokinase|nr:sugar kinase [Eubacteriales bacterium]MDH7567161.1 sugar kinase [Clostridiales bacterium]
MGKFITFGEIMLRLAPIGYERFVQSKEFGVVYGGGEANVAVSLANFGKEAYFVTKLPKHEIGQAAVNELRRFGVHTNYIVRGGERIGIYFCEKGAAQRPSKVVYDRAHSSISEVGKEDFNWREIFEGAEWFHFTGITPALSDNCAQVCMDAAKAAKEAGVTVSVDLNYRKKLWSGEKAGKVMGELIRYCDVVIANEEDAEKVFGIKAEETDITGGQLSGEGYRKVAKELVDRFKLKYAAITLRESYSASDNGWSAVLYDGSHYFTSKKYNVHIVDRVGGGDSFAAGLIYGLSSGMDLQSTLEFAVAASCLKHTVEGDFNMASVEEVKTLMEGDGSGRVQR